MNGKFVFGVDLDGVVADFYSAMREVAAEWLEVPLNSLTTEPTYGVPEWSLDMDRYLHLHKFAVTQRDFFRNLKPVQGAGPTLRLLSSEFDIHIRIITHRLFIPNFHQVAVQQTVEWLDRHDIPYWDLCFMKDKGAVDADLYIDDSPHNIEALQREKLPVIIFSNSTNRHLSGCRANNWAEVGPLVRAEMERWKKFAEVRQAATN